MSTTISENDIPATANAGKEEQYSLAKILGIWALAAVPMGILSWVVFPAVSPDYKTDPLGAGVVRLVLIILGLIWLFVLSLLIVRREEGDLHWATVKRRLRLTGPRDPKTGETRRRLWLWLIPFLLGFAAWDLVLTSHVSGLWTKIFPFFAEPPGYSMGSLFQSQEILHRLHGAWWFLGLFLVNAIFNTILGEEFLFRGVLLPKMEGVFGKWSWVANGVLFGFYHFHQPWVMLDAALSGVLFIAFPSWRWRTTWMGIIIHSAETVYFTYLILGVILGLA